MHPLSKMGGGSNVLYKKSVGEGQINLILRGRFVMGLVNFSRGGQRIFGENDCILYIQYCISDIISSLRCEGYFEKRIQFLLNLC